MASIVLATQNARYMHASLALRCLKANLGPLRDEAVLREFLPTDRAADMAEAILRDRPRIVGLSVSIWNVSTVTDVVKILKRVRPELAVVLGGPEVSFETQNLEIARHADHVITGDGETAFASLAGALLEGRAPEARIIPR